MSRNVTLFLILSLLSSAAARAATVSFAVVDRHGQPVADAVVSLVKPDSRPFTATEAASRAVVDQRNLAFAPLVSVVRRGATVEFKNNDHVRHHVYSFADIKRFEFVLAPGETSPSLGFSDAGIAAVGCNIHDNMLAYVYVTDAPWSAVTDAKGHATISGVSAGDMRARVWHPRLQPAAADSDQAIAVAPAGSTVSFELLLTPARSSAAGHRRSY